MVSGIIKVTKSLEDRHILLKETNEKVINQVGGFLRLLTGVGLPLMKNVLMPLAKNILIPLGLTAASATNGALQKKIHELWMTTLIISNVEIKNFTKIFKSVEQSSLLIKSASETFEKEAKRTKTLTSWHVIRYIRCYFIRKYVSR